MNRTPFGTYSLFVTLIAIYLIELMAGLADDELMLLMFGGLADNGHLHGQYWRLLTYGFVHGSPLSIILNCSLLLIVGPKVEQNIGILAPLGFFVLASILGGLALLAKGANWPSLGTNVGATAGVLGLSCIHLYLRARRPAVK